MPISYPGIQPNHQPNVVINIAIVHRNKNKMDVGGKIIKVSDLLIIFMSPKSENCHLSVTNVTPGDSPYVQIGLYVRVLWIRNNVEHIKTVNIKIRKNVRCLMMTLNG